MKLFERFRSFWSPRSEDDHPLTEREREAPPPTALDEAARVEAEFVGDDFDPDAQRE